MQSISEFSDITAYGTGAADITNIIKSPNDLSVFGIKKSTWATIDFLKFCEF